MKSKILLILMVLVVMADGAIIGNNGVESSHGAQANWKLVLNTNVTALSSGQATRVVVYTDASVNAVNESKLCVYNGNGENADLLGGATLVNAVPGAWNSVNVDFAITQSSNYYPTIIDNNSAGINYGGTGEFYYPSGSVTYANEPTAKLQATTVYSQNISLYLEYAPSGTTSYTLSISAGTGGTVANSSLTMYDGFKKNISATPSYGYKFKRWTVVSGTVTFDAYTSQYSTLTIGSNASIKAEFEPIRKILCIGNSITSGTGTADGSSYRKVLQDSLGVGAWDFVGGQNSTMGEPYDNNHSGISGDYISQIFARLNTDIGTYIVNAGSKSAVIILAGTNNVYNNSNEATYGSLIDSVEDMIDTIVAHNSGIYILVGLLPPSTDATFDEHITIYNGLLSTMIDTKNNTVTKLYAVDYNTAFKAVNDWQNQLMSDFAHPQAAGYKVMADEIYKILGPAFNMGFTLQPVNDTITGDGQEVTFTATYPFDSILDWRDAVGDSSIDQDVSLTFTADKADTGKRIYAVALDGTKFYYSDTVQIVYKSPSPITFTTQPKSDTLKVGETALFYVVAECAGNGPIHYKWVVNGSVYGTDNDSITFAATLVLDNSTIVCKSWSVGDDTLASNTVTLRVYQPCTWDSVGIRQGVYLKGTRSQTIDSLKVGNLANPTVWEKATIAGQSSTHVEFYLASLILKWNSAAYPIRIYHALGYDDYSLTFKKSSVSGSSYKMTLSLINGF